MTTRAMPKVASAPSRNRPHCTNAATSRVTGAANFPRSPVRTPLPDATPPTSRVRSLRQYNGSSPPPAGGRRSPSPASVKQEEDGHAAAKDLFDVLKQALEADPNSKDQLKYYRAVQHALKKLGKAPNAWAGPGTPLGAAVSQGRTDMTRLLLRANADPNQADGKGVTELHRAAFDGSVETCRLLLLAHADVNSCDRYGQTPLFFTPARDVCKLLIDHQSDVNVLNRKGQSALHIAGKNGFEEVLAWMSYRVSKSLVDLRDASGVTAHQYLQQVTADQGNAKMQGFLTPTPCRSTNAPGNREPNAVCGELFTSPDLDTSESVLKADGVQKPKERRRLAVTTSPPSTAPCSPRDDQDETGAKQSSSFDDVPPVQQEDQRRPELGPALFFNLTGELSSQEPSPAEPGIFSPFSLEAMYDAVGKNKELSFLTQSGEDCSAPSAEPATMQEGIMRRASSPRPSMMKEGTMRRASSPRPSMSKGAAIRSSSPRGSLTKDATPGSPTRQTRRSSRKSPSRSSSSSVAAAAAAASPEERAVSVPDASNSINESQASPGALLRNGIIEGDELSVIETLNTSQAVSEPAGPNTEQQEVDNMQEGDILGIEGEEVF